MKMRDFVDRHFRHFNAATLKDASDAWLDLLGNDGKMMVCLAGAMSTAELGRSLAEMIRQDKVHAITCTGANLEEDIFRMVAHSHYRRIANYRDLTPADEQALLEQGLNRVTDTCIPEDEAVRRMEKTLLTYWKRADQAGERCFPHEFIYQALLDEAFDVDPTYDVKDSWLLAAAQKNLPIYVPGWEDSTTGNEAVTLVRQGHLKTLDTFKTGPYYMDHLITWYLDTCRRHPIGMFQIGGGIAGDFPICVVPLINQDMTHNLMDGSPTGIEPVPLWSYFCQISDSTTSYGSYSGAVPNEKITWEKVSPETPRFVIESDATIVAPIVFHYVLDL